MEADLLKKQIEERKALVREIVGFFEWCLKNLPEEDGLTVKSQEENNYTKVDYHFLLAGFFFTARTGQSMEGGNTFSVYPGQEFSKTGILFEFYYQDDIENGKVLKFAEGDWATEIKSVIQNKEGFIAAKKEEREKEKKLAEEKKEAKRQEEALNEEAKRWGIIPTGS